jgi:hypothetical protein
VQIHTPQIHNGWLEGDFRTTGGANLNLVDTIKDILTSGYLRADSIKSRAAYIRRVQLDSIYFHHDSTDTSYRPNGATVRSGKNEGIENGNWSSYVVMDSVKAAKVSVSSLICSYATIGGFVGDTSSGFAISFPSTQFSTPQTTVGIIVKRTAPAGYGTVSMIQLTVKGVSANNSTGTADSAILETTDGSIPAKYRPAADVYLPMTVINAGLPTGGAIKIGSDGNIHFLPSDIVSSFVQYGGHFVSYGSQKKGFYSFTISYPIWP